MGGTGAGNGRTAFLQGNVVKKLGNTPRINCRARGVDALRSNRVRSGLETSETCHPPQWWDLREETSCLPCLSGAEASGWCEQSTESSQAVFFLLLIKTANDGCVFEAKAAQPE